MKRVWLRVMGFRLKVTERKLKHLEHIRHIGTLREKGHRDQTPVLFLSETKCLSALPACR